MQLRSLVPLLTIGFLSMASTAAAAEHKVTVSAGPFDRRDCVVQFKLPDDTEAGGYALTDDAGPRTPVQVGPGGRATFILNSSSEYRKCLTPLP